MKKVSILIPCYNSEKWVGETLDCCLRQTYPNIEIILVDDGSTDNSLAIARDYERKDERIHVFSQPNSGGCRARNLAFEKSTGDYIKYLDADDLMSDDMIEMQMKRLEKANDSLAISTCSWQEFWNSTNVKFCKRCIYKDYNDPIELLTDLWTKSEMFAVTCYLVPRQLISLVGKWDEQLTKNQDGDFFCRVLSKTSKVLFCKSPQFYYRRGHFSVSTQNSLSPTKMQSSLDSRINYEKTILPIRNTPLVRRGLALNYSIVMFNSPVNSKWFNEAKRRIYALGEKPIHPTAKGIQKKIVSIIGLTTYLQIKELLEKH
ncbi:glycosyltransferase family 2 protein, partial [Bacteroides fragilis]|jgi:glycosyltransferase involved in cell wall biosynthesis|uniref:Glycosyltransferase n=1 Tax=Bacteroides fragilis TaxID=817 RepID=A0A413JTT4_BACFG|nr:MULTISPECIES: glycosyltransferase family 2 protein [Bacteroides]EKA80944.1 hypothetical protein HMPREF1205_04353 [Bacteroides fragilis HMW 616]MBU3043644.1 glycosyltransferase [Bacteroides sp. HF-4919]MBY2894135.1 hypothetical protein [Bacteroides fragilis]MCE8602286.1 glycosyltransferase [Bacteroides fragilis]MCE8634238.1 glycosyltransferase [Bacteroides fragilis]